MAMSNLINENEVYIKNAINEGIGPDVINSTLEDVINISDKSGKTPKQVKETVETIVKMKKKIGAVDDKRYSSSFVRENSQKIESALNEGITPNEVASTLVDFTNNVHSKEDKKHLSFTVRLISKMKKKELTLNRSNQQEKSYEKVMIK